MSQMEIDRVLSQIRSIANATKAGAAGSGAAVGVKGIDNGFAKILKQGLDTVNSTQMKATDLANKFERGVPGVELPQVMLEMQKANVSFRALAEVRNKFVEAYREIMNMPL
jgi:flagellar hook-basal body complex protein FliE